MRAPEATVPLDTLGLRRPATASTTRPPGTAGAGRRPRRDVERVGQAADRAAALVELADVDQHDLEAPVLQLRAHPVRAPAGITTVRPITIEFAQNVSAPPPR